jgi:hypothetical protein
MKKPPGCEPRGRDWSIMTSRTVARAGMLRARRRWIKGPPTRKGPPDAMSREPGGEFLPLGPSSSPPSLTLLAVVIGVKRRLSERGRVKAFSSGGWGRSFTSQVHPPFRVKSPIAAVMPINIA